MGIKTTIALLSAIVFFTANLVSAQEYATHAVKEGETLYSIAQKYSVPPYTLLQANKGLKKVSRLKENTILIIPLEDFGVAPPKEPQEEATQASQAPLGFIQHKVRRKETLYGLARRYRLTEEQLKRYNIPLYVAPLKKGMILQIPMFAEPRSEEELAFETYTVQARETRWSIAHKYGITVDSLVAINPELDKNSNYLGVGQELQLPRPRSGSVQAQSLARYISYTVPPQMTLYRLGKTYNTLPDSIVKLNPEITKTGGLKEGMVIRLPKKQDHPAEINTQNYIFYEVKPKQTLYGLTRSLQISSDTLLRLNPALKEGLKAGMVLKLPKEKAKDFEVKNALVLDKINLIDSIRVENRLKIVFMLPFRLDKINLDKPEKTQDLITTRKDISLSLGLYSGALVAIDSIKKYGVSVAVQTYDTELSHEKVKEIFAKDSLVNVSAIIGPLDADVLEAVAQAASKKDIPVIAPVTSDRGLGYGNVFFSLPREEILRETMLSHLNKIHTRQNIIVIADAEHTAARSTILMRFPRAQTAEVIDDKTLNLRTFLNLLSREKENWVFLETHQPGMVASVTSILNSANSEKTPIRLFTTSHNSAFNTESLSSAHLSNIRFTYPSFYKEVVDDAFVSAYQKRFNGLQPNPYAVRGFDVTFDILLKLAHKNNLFATSEIIGLTEYTGNRFNYFNNWTAGYYNKACYLMQYDGLQIKEIELNDLESNL